MAGKTVPELAAQSGAVQDTDLFVSYRGSGPLKSVTAATLKSGLATSAALAASGGSALVGFLPAGTGAVTRTAQAKMRDFVSVKDFGAVGDGVANDSAAFDAALAYIETLPRGGEIFFPPGIYLADLNMRALSSNFDKRITLRGAGRGSTQIKPTGTGVIMLNLMGRNVATIQDMTFYSGDSFAASCAIYMARSTLSADCNNNRFINLEIVGNFQTHAVVQSGAESGMWFSCRIAPNNGSAAPDSGFWIGHDPALSGVTPPVGTPIAGPCTDNRMIACETYIPYDDARHITFSDESGWTIVGHGFIGGTSNGQRFITFEAPTAGVFNGPISILGGLMECFGTNNKGIFLDTPAGASTWNGLHVGGGGSVNVSGDFVYLDFNRNQLATGDGPLCVDYDFTMPTIPAAVTNGFPVYFHNLSGGKIDWRGRNGQGTVVVFGFASQCPIRCFEPLVAQLNNCNVDLWMNAEPTSGTFAKGQRIQREYGGSAVGIGDQVDWICSLSGSYGSVSTTSSTVLGFNQITVADATGIKPGQMFQVGGLYTRVVAVSGTTLTLAANALATASGVVTQFYPGGSAAGFFDTFGSLGMMRAAAQADSTAATLADLVTDFNALLAKRRAANEQA